MYIEFSEYFNKGGEADCKAFPRLVYRAEKLIDQYTHNRIHDMAAVPEAVKWCVVELANAMNATDPTMAAVTPALSGYNTDGYSETYSDSVTAESLEKAYYDIIKTYLGNEKDDTGTPLMYAGVC